MNVFFRDIVVCKFNKIVKYEEELVAKDGADYDLILTIVSDRRVPA